MCTDAFVSKTVLLVEDLDFLRKMVGEFLQSLGMRVFESSIGAEAIQIVRSHAGTIDLLLTDLEMPGMSGWESAKKIAALKPGIRILFMSGGITAQEWQDHKQEPAGAYFIQKPLSMNELKTLLMDILAT